MFFEGVEIGDQGAASESVIITQNGEVPGGVPDFFFTAIQHAANLIDGTARRARCTFEFSFPKKKSSFSSLDFEIFDRRGPERRPAGPCAPDFTKRHSGTRSLGHPRWRNARAGPRGAPARAVRLRVNAKYRAFDLRGGARCVH